MGAALVLFGAGVVTGSYGGAQHRHGSVVDEAADQIVRDAQHPPRREDLRRAAVDGMLRRLGDRYARYYAADGTDDSGARLSGRYSGVGVWLRDGPAGQVEVTAVQSDSPAARGGIHAGDTLIRVGGTVRGAGLPTFAAALRGRPGTPVRLVVGRGHGTHEVTLTRAAISRHDVTSKNLGDGITLLRVSMFSAGSGGEVRGVVRGERPGRDHGYILDLRGNPGGLLDEAVGATSAFLSGGGVVSYARRGRPAHDYQAPRGGDTRTPLVVLVDHKTASAAEVVAGALQDRNRAVVVGSRTYGKGTVQEESQLSDGSSLELTVARYRTPRGRTLDGVGIDPDVTVAPSSRPAAAENRAKDVLDGLRAAARHAAPPKEGRG